MKTPVNAVSAALVVGAALCLQALSAEARGMDKKAVACECASESPAFQLVRDDDEVKLCNLGYYCDCKQGKRKSCVNFWVGGWKYDEPAQKCEFSFSCEAFFEGPATTAEPATTEPTTPEPTTMPPDTTTPGMPSSCDCGARTTGQQLIRGEDQVELCEAGYYCDCAAQEPRRCDVVWSRAWRFDEYFQTCSWVFDCAGYDYSTTTPEPATTSRPLPTTEPTTTSAPTPAPFCSSPDVQYELIRGDDELSMCKRGYYKDCVNEKVKHCVNLYGFGWMFNEEKQKCQFMQNCEELFDN